MIEALIRDDKRLICLICIRPGPDKESLNVDIFIPSEGKTLSGVMPAGGEPAQQVARAVMTVFPVSALPLEERAVPLSPETLESHLEGQPVDSSEDDKVKISKDVFPEVWTLVQRRMSALDKREAVLIDREKKLTADIENFRKSHPGDPLGERPKYP